MIFNEVLKFHKIHDFLRSLNLGVTNSDRGFDCAHLLTLITRSW